jgi:hypothetical protein
VRLRHERSRARARAFRISYEKYEADNKRNKAEGHHLPTCQEQRQRGVAILICPGGSYWNLAGDLGGPERRRDSCLVEDGWCDGPSSCPLRVRSRTRGGQSAWCGAAPRSGGPTRTGLASSASRRAPGRGDGDLISIVTGYQSAPDMRVASPATVRTIKTPQSLATPSPHATTYLIV